MNLDIILVFIILIAVVLLFATGWVRRDIVPILVLVSLAVFDLVSPEELFAGFSSKAVITVAALFVISSGLVRTGVVDRVANYLKYLTKESNFRLILASTALPGILAGFILIVPTVFFFIPTVMRMALQNNIPRSRLLLPMAVSCLLGANLTLIGASHNLIVNSLVIDSVGEGFTFFEFMPLGFLLLTAAVLYNFFFGKLLLPDKDVKHGDEKSASEDLVKTYGLYDRLWELWVKENCSAAGKCLRETGLGERYGLNVIAIVRAGEQLQAEKDKLIIQAGDVLLVLGREERIKDLVDQEGLILAGRPNEQEDFPLSTAELVEVVIPPRSPIIGKTLSEINFREKTGLSGIALWRKGQPVRTDVGSQPLREGDALLLFGDRKKTQGFEPKPSFVWLHAPRSEETPKELRRLGPAAVLILFVVVITSALGWLSIAVAALLGVVGMFFLGIFDLKQAYESIEWRTIVLIGGLYPLGLALEKSGAAALLADILVGVSGNLGPIGALLGVALISMLLTQPLHNVAAAVVMTPIALNAAQTLGANPKAFAVTVIVGVSAAFLMPIGHTAPLLVQKPGNYSSKDYLKFGLGLCLIVLIIITLTVPLLWPLTN